MSCPVRLYHQDSLTRNVRCSSFKIWLFATLWYIGFGVHDRALTKRMRVYDVILLKKQLLEFSRESSNYLDSVNVFFWRPRNWEELYNTVYEMFNEVNSRLWSANPRQSVLALLRLENILFLFVGPYQKQRCLPFSLQSWGMAHQHKFSGCASNTQGCQAQHKALGNICFLSSQVCRREPTRSLKGGIEAGIWSVYSP